MQGTLKIIWFQPSQAHCFCVWLFVFWVTGLLYVETVQLSHFPLDNKVQGNIKLMPSLWEIVICYILKVHDIFLFIYVWFSWNRKEGKIICEALHKIQKNHFVKLFIISNRNGLERWFFFPVKIVLLRESRFTYQCDIIQK